MKITVVLCSYNRCESLAKALESVARSEVPAQKEWEVLVVDNNSTDLTSQVVDEFCRKYPRRFRYLLERQPGKSYALNSGIREANADVLAFMDDDVTVEPTWLDRLTAPLEDPKCSGTGGRILPSHEFSWPRWFSLDEPYALGGVLCAHFDLGDESKQLNRPPYGTNMAFKREMFENYGGFRTDLGPSPNKDTPHPNDDTEFGDRLLAAGETLLYVPTAVVHHYVPEDRLKKEYFLRFWFDYGRANIRELARRPDICGIPRPYLTMLKHVVVIAPVRIFAWLTAWQPVKRFYNKCLVWRTFGQIVEIQNRWFSRRPPQPSGLKSTTEHV